MTVDQKEIYTGYRSVIVTMTEARGLELCWICDSAINGEIFIDFLKSLRKRFGATPLALFMDQLRVHKASPVRPAYDQLDIRPVWNVGYSPEFNPVEAVFSKVKYQFCRSRLNNLVNKVGFNADKEIKAALGKIEQDHCAACARKSLYLL